MDDGKQWTGRKAARLQDAVEMTQEEFAGKLGVSVRSVAAWRANPGYAASATGRSVRPPARDALLA